MRIHKEERKYLCPDCGYKCKWVNQLKYHMTKHTGESGWFGQAQGVPLLPEVASVLAHSHGTSVFTSRGMGRLKSQNSFPTH